MALPLYLPDLDDDPPGGPEGAAPGVMNCRRGTTCGAPWGGIRWGWEGGGFLAPPPLMPLEGGGGGGGPSPLPPLAAAFWPGLALILIPAGGGGAWGCG